MYLQIQQVDLRNETTLVRSSLDRPWLAHKTLGIASASQLIGKTAIPGKLTVRYVM
jgi:hypothetical protein